MRMFTIEAKTFPGIYFVSISWVFIFRFSMILIKACLNYELVSCLDPDCNSFVVSELAKLASIDKRMLVTAASYKIIFL